MFEKALEKIDVSDYNHHPVDTTKLIPVSKIYGAYKKLKNIINRTPLHYSIQLSEYYGARIYLKRVIYLVYPQGRPPNSQELQIERGLSHDDLTTSRVEGKNNILCKCRKSRIGSSVCLQLVEDEMFDVYAHFDTQHQV